jgi:CMP-2-keto-3-deoxyoctulosonic acid synthetase
LAEKLDQLRFLQGGVPIMVAETPHDTIGVDTEGDLQRVNALFASGAVD